MPNMKKETSKIIKGNHTVLCTYESMYSGVWTKAVMRRPTGGGVGGGHVHVGVGPSHSGGQRVSYITLLGSGLHRWPCITIYGAGFTAYRASQGLAGLRKLPIHRYSWLHVTHVCRAAKGLIKFLSSYTFCFLKLSLWTGFLLHVENMQVEVRPMYGRKTRIKSLPMFYSGLICW